MTWVVACCPDCDRPSRIIEVARPLGFGDSLTGEEWAVIHETGGYNCEHCGESLGGAVMLTEAMLS